MRKFLSACLLLWFAATAAVGADAYLGTKPAVTTLHATTNYIVLVLGDGTNSLIRKVSPTQLLAILEGLAGWPATNYSGQFAISSDKKLHLARGAGVTNLVEYYGGTYISPHWTNMTPTRWALVDSNQTAFIEFRQEGNPNRLVYYGDASTPNGTYKHQFLMPSSDDGNLEPAFGINFNDTWSWTFRERQLEWWNGFGAFPIITNAPNGDVYLANKSANTILQGGGTVLSIVGTSIGLGGPVMVTNTFSAQAGSTLQGVIFIPSGSSIVNSNSSFRRRVALWNGNQQLDSTGASGVSDTELGTLVGIDVTKTVQAALDSKIDEISGSASNLTLLKLTQTNRVLRVDGTGLIKSVDSVSPSTEYVKADGTTGNPIGSGDVVGPASSTDKAVVRFDATTGKAIQMSAATIDDTGVGTFDSLKTTNGVWAGTVAKIIQGSGTPESVVTANVGSIYQCTNCSGNTAIYLKTNGTSSTGWWLLAGGGGTSSPGGANMQLQYNVSNTVAGSIDMTWDGTNNILRIGNATGQIRVGNNAGGAYMIVSGSVLGTSSDQAVNWWVNGSPRWVIGNLSENYNLRPSANRTLDFGQNNIRPLNAYIENTITTNLTVQGAAQSNRVLFVNASGNVTNVTSASPSTEYVLANGTTATPAGTGDLVGPAAATDNALVRFDTGTGKLAQNSGTMLEDDGTLRIVGSISNRPISIYAHATVPLHINGTNQLYFLNLTNNALVMLTNMKADVTYHLRCLRTNNSSLTWSNVPTTSWRSGFVESPGTNWSDFYFEIDSQTGITNAWAAGAELALAGGQNYTFSTNAGTITATVNSAMTNLDSVNWKVQQPAITASNLVVSFATNTFELVGLTNVVLTNLVELLNAQSGDTKIIVRNTIGANIPIVWPAYGAQHGYFFRTNINNPILQWAAVTNAKTAVIALTCVGTNIFGTISEWP